MGTDEAESYFREQAQALVEGGVDLFVLETFRDLNECGAAIAAVRSVSTLPIVAQMTIEDDGNSLDGTPPEQFAPELEKRGADVIARGGTSISHRPSTWPRMRGASCFKACGWLAVAAAPRRSTFARSR